MEMMSSKFKERENQASPLNSPSSHGSSTTTSTCSNTNNGTHHNPQYPHPPSPLPITRSDPNSPYPTTFVTADTSSFKQVVQMLTGSPDSPKTHPINQPSQTQPKPQQPDPKNFVIPPIKTTPKKPGFKLYERRNSLKHMMISPLTANFAAAAAAHQQQQNAATFSPRNNNFLLNHHHHNYSNNHNQNHYRTNMPEILSPSLLDFPSLTLSPVTPLVEDPFDKSFSSPSINGGGSSSSEEDKAIAEKGFYFHPSPASTTPRDSEPQLLPLFPLSSPRVSDP